MRVFTCNDHEGYWPVGTASVVVAETEEQARESLANTLADMGLDHEGFTLEEVDLTVPQVIVLRDGEY